MVKITVHDAEHWITVHPNGNKEEKGTPLLIEGSNGHYVVKGGAGGKLNGKTVNPKSMSKARKGTEGSNGGGEPAPEKQPVGVPEGSASHPPKEAAKPNPMMWLPLWNHIEEKHELYENELIAKIKEGSKHLQGGSWAGKFDLTKAEEIIQAEREKRGIKPWGTFERPEGFATITENKTTGGWTVGHTNPEVPPMEFHNWSLAQAHRKALGEASDPVAFAKEAIEKEKAARNKPAEVKKIPDIGNGNSMYEVNGTHRRYTLELNKKQLEKGFGEVAEKFLAENGNKMQRYLPQTLARACPTKEIFAERLEIERLNDLVDRAEGKERADLKQKVKDHFDRIEELKIEAAGVHGEALKQRQKAEAERKAMQAKVTKREAYVPHKTAAEASAWAIRNNLADNVDYGNLSAEVANEGNKALLYYVENFPELRPMMRLYGSCQFIKKDNYERDRASHAVELAASGYDGKDLENQLRKDIKLGAVGSNTWAFASLGYLGFNERHGDDAAKEAMNASMKRCVESKWHPEGCDTIKSIFDHEFGHKLDFMLGADKDPEMLKLYRSAKRKGIIKEALSEYGSKNISEFIAEAWSEAINNPTPRPAAQKVEAIIKRLYADYKSANSKAA